MTCTRLYHQEPSGIIVAQITQATGVSRSAVWYRDIVRRRARNAMNQGTIKESSSYACCFVAVVFT